MAAPAAVPGVDPSRVSTPDELAACLDGLRRRRGLSYEAMGAAARVLSRSGRSRLEPLPKSTVGEIVTGKRIPTKGKLLAFLAVCEVAPADLAQWVAAWERARTAGLARHSGWRRVRDARPRLLGVHDAIKVDKKVPGELPVYVPRDIDDGLRAELATNAQRGCFVLLVGGSSVGKTRTLYEAVMAALPDWWLVQPAGPAEVTALTQAPVPRTVVWLDEFQRYLDGQHGLTGAVMRALLTATNPAVIVGTLWPDKYNTYSALPAPGAVNLHKREREVLDLAAVIHIAPEFSPAEQDRAVGAAGRDRRLAVALNAAEYGLTQTLAAAPQLVARWQNAKTADPYAWAVLAAALDVARLGARAPLSPDLLRAAAPGYCTSQQQAEAPDNWFEQALAYATEKLHGAAAALSPAGDGMGRLAGYTVAEYLIQHASRQRRYARVPTITWDAVLSDLRDPADLTRLADSARSRLLCRYAIELYRHAAHAGDGYAARELADLLAGLHGDLEGAAQILRARADIGDTDAAFQLTGLLAQHGDLEGLRALAEDGDRYAARQFADLLALRGDLDGLRAWADAGDNDAAWRLAGWLAESGDLDELRARADAGDEPATFQVAMRLAERGDLEELRIRADAGDGYAAGKLVDLLAQRGDLHGLRTRADGGDRYAGSRLVGLLAQRGDLDGLRTLADGGDGSAARELARLRAKHGDLEGLRALADGGDESADQELIDLLAQRGDLDGLRTRADGGHGHAASRLVMLLAERGDLDGLRARADSDGYAARELAGLLAERGDLGGAARILCALADGGDDTAVWRLSDLLAEGGDLEGLRARADDGDGYAAVKLVDLLAKRGDLDGLRTLADSGDEAAVLRLAGLLVDMLVRQGRAEEAERLRRFGFNPDGSIAHS